MSHHREEPIQIEGIPEEEGVSGEDAEEQLAESREEKRNYTETHPDEARRERERRGEEEPRG
ncbi:hypothetical protein [Nocardioides sp. B-3]|uniref:hypothetical protein n=1 Tax=Nocardioides sp. B-3 TaxID=2895565 RepID=UPI003FA6062D